MDDKLRGLLKDGGYFLYARHGEATVGEDLPDLSFYRCDTQRNLSDFGRMQSVRYGEKLRSLQIPISYPVVASPYCRAAETAILAFGRQNVTTDSFWADVHRLSGNITSFERNRILNNVQSKFERIPPKGKNQVIIAHTFPDGIGLGQIKYMETIIIRPLGEGYGYRVICKWQ